METATQLNNLSVLLPLLAVVFIIATGVIVLNLHFHKNLFRQKLVQEELLNKHQQELLRSSIQTQEDERMRIAGDIHDELGAVLAIAKMYLVTIEERSSDTVGEHLETVLKVRSLVETTITSIRRISHELMPQNLQVFGLADSLLNLAQMINGTKGILVGVTCPAEVNRLAWPVTLGLYRICLELINNTIRHAQAQRIDLSIALLDDYVELRYTDNGVGISAGTKKTGLGHKSMEARAIALGGTIHYGSNKTGGYCAILKVPLALYSNV